ncbi:hypothetical protein FA13DRAFT_1717027, partial [Coprinellus micaceus]
NGEDGPEAESGSRESSSDDGQSVSGSSKSESEGAESTEEEEDDGSEEESDRDEDAASTGRLRAANDPLQRTSYPTKTIMPFMQSNHNALEHLLAAAMTPPPTLQTLQQGRGRNSAPSGGLLAEVVVVIIPCLEQPRLFQTHCFSSAKLP